MKAYNEKILKISLFLLLSLCFSSYSFAQITAEDTSGNNFEIELAVGESINFTFNLNAVTATEEITSARSYGSGISFVNECTQDFSSNLTCESEVSIDGTTQGTKRLEFRTAAGQRLRISLKISRIVDDGTTLDGSLFSSLLSSSPSPNLDFGEVSDKVYETFYIKNNSNTFTSEIAPINSLDTGFSLGNFCSGRRIPPKGYCKIRVFFDPSGVLGGNHTQTINIQPEEGSTNPFVITVLAQTPIPPQARVQVDAGIVKVDPTACLALAGINPSECYFEAENSPGETTISSVFCSEATGVCSVSISKKIANEPVEFNIAVQFNEEDIQDNDDSTDENGNNPFDFTLTTAEVNLGDLSTADDTDLAISLNNITPLLSLPLPYVFSVLSGAENLVSFSTDCSSLLLVSQSCSYSLRIKPSVLGSGSVQVSVLAAGVTKSLTINFTGVSSNPSGDSSITYDDGSTYDSGKVYN